MTVKILLTSFFVLFTANLSFGQDTIEVTTKVAKDITEVYNVLKSDMKTREGLYQMRYKKTKAMASGMYRNDKRVGTWLFFNPKGTLLQRYNYDKNNVMYEAPEDRTPRFNYKVDKNFSVKDTVLKPVKIGGRYYGYLPLLQLFQKPKDVSTDGALSIPAFLELLVSPGGNLADYIIHVDGYDLNVNLNLLSAEDKRFVPAVMNGEPIACTIMISCIMRSNGKLEILEPQEPKQKTDTKQASVTF